MATMTTFIIIYLVGYVLTFAMVMAAQLYRANDKVTFYSVSVAAVFALLSWVLITFVLVDTIVGIIEEKYGRHDEIL